MGEKVDAAKLLLSRVIHCLDDIHGLGNITLPGVCVLIQSKYPETSLWSLSICLL